MKTLEERKQAIINELMHYTSTNEIDECWFIIKTILEYMVEVNVIKDYDSKELSKMMFKNTEFDLDRMKW